MKRSSKSRKNKLSATVTFPDMIVQLPPESLQPYPRNARTHSKKQKGQIADSIERFGFTSPVLIDDSDMILAGHGRVEAAKLLGLATVPCIRLSSLTEPEKRAYVLADNKLALNAGWDEDLLADELKLVLADHDEIDISLTGFSVPEIDLLIETGETGPTPPEAEDDVIPKPTAVTITRPGDIWQLGDHRLVCGDARDDAIYRQLLARPDGTLEIAQMGFSDPPYNVKIQGNVSGSKRHAHREFAMASGEMSPSQFTEFLEITLSRIASWSCDGSIHFICMDWRHMDELSAAGKAAFTELKNVIVWVKDNGGMGTFYRSRYELIFVYKSGTAAHINAFELGQNGRYRTNVWNYRGISSSTATAREELAMHPTVKPVALVADAIKDCSQRGGIILDPFCGSGTILIAAHKTGRRARALELDPSYCDVAIRRWQAFAKDDAILVATGETFDQCAQRRRLEASARSTSSDQEARR